MKLSFEEYLISSKKVLCLMKNEEFINSILRANTLLKTVIRMNKPVLICGNGGSAADALHIAGELMGKFLVDRRPIKAIALAADIALLTAVANDYDYKDVFSRQVQAHGEEEGILIALSTSGESINTIDAAITARRKGMKVIALTGANGGHLEPKADVCIKIPSNSTPLIQQGHQIVYHYLCLMAETSVIPQT